ncbi:MAG TPA: alpha/beta hydrolase, partial [Solirubrobacteraceae bacterium]
VLLGGVTFDGSIWQPVTDELARDHRVIVPTLPLGAHRRPMKPDADLTLEGFGDIVQELVEKLDLRDVTIVQNDHAAGLVYAARNPDRVARLVISSCEAFENYPPGLPGKNLRIVVNTPGGIFVAMQSLRLRALRRLPVTLGWMSKRPLPDDLVDTMLRPMQTQRGVRRDLGKYARSARKRQMVELCERLKAFTKPVLVVWTPEDRVAKPDHGRRFAATLPDARLVEIEDSYTLIMRDQPEAFARAIREFVRETAGVPAA